MSVSEGVSVLLVGTPSGKNDEVVAMLRMTGAIVESVPELDAAVAVLLNRPVDVLLLTSALQPDELTELQGFLRHSAGKDDGTLLLQSSEIGSAEDFATALQNARCEKVGASSPGGSGTTFDSAAFREQCLNEPSIMVEVIDIFLAERPSVVMEMSDALASGRLADLSRFAHSLKGSLAALRTPAGHRLAAALEVGAQQGNLILSSELFSQLLSELETVSERLSHFRDECQPT